MITLITSGIKYKIMLMTIIPVIDLKLITTWNKHKQYENRIPKKNMVKPWMASCCVPGAETYAVTE